MHVRSRHALSLALLAAVVAVAGCASEPSVEGAQPAPSPDWQPLMTQPATEAVGGDTSSALQGVIDAWVDQAKVGVTAAVVTADGVWHGASGTDGAGTELEPDAALALASISKTFTAAEVMTLVESGRVDLDTPIDTYVDLPFDTGGATVRQVLNMRSGFPYDPLFKPAMNEALTEDLDRSWSGDEVLDLAADETAHQGQLGGDFNYNNLNYIALGALIDAVAGQPAAEVIRRDLLEPAGLHRSWSQDAEQPQAPLTVAVEPVAEPNVDEDGPWLPSRSWASAAGTAGGMAARVPRISRAGAICCTAPSCSPPTRCSR